MGLIEMPNGNISSRASIGAGSRDSDHKEVPIQVMVPEAVRRQVALMGADSERKHQDCGVAEFSRGRYRRTCLGVQRPLQSPLQQ